MKIKEEKKRNKPWYGGIKYAAGGRGYVTKISLVGRTFLIQKLIFFLIIKKSILELEID